MKTVMRVAFIFNTGTCLLSINKLDISGSYEINIETVVLKIFKYNNYVEKVIIIIRRSQKWFSE